MTKVTFKGTEGAEKKITSLGVSFEAGVARVVPDNLVAKFRGNKDFKVEGSEETQSDEVEDRSYTVEELTKVLIDADVKIPKKAVDDAEALMTLVVAEDLKLPE